MQVARGVFRFAVAAAAALALPGCCSILCPSPGPNPDLTPSPITTRGLVKVMRTSSGTTTFLAYQYQDESNVWIARTQGSTIPYDLPPGDYQTLLGLINPTGTYHVSDGLSLCKYAKSVDPGNGPYTVSHLLPETPLLPPEMECPP